MSCAWQDNAKTNTPNVVRSKRKMCLLDGAARRNRLAAPSLFADARDVFVRDSLLEAAESSDSETVLLGQH